MAAVAVRRLKLPDVEVLTALGGIKEFRHLALFGHPFMHLAAGGAAPLVAVMAASTRVDG
jgi:hypothetical protein